jgi:hypothetical protein
MTGATPKPMTDVLAALALVGAAAFSMLEELRAVEGLERDPEAVKRAVARFVAGLQANGRSAAGGPGSGGTASAG